MKVKKEITIFCVFFFFMARLFCYYSNDYRLSLNALTKNKCGFHLRNPTHIHEHEYTVNDVSILSSTTRRCQSKKFYIDLMNDFPPFYDQKSPFSNSLQNLWFEIITKCLPNLYNICNYYSFNIFGSHSLQGQSVQSLLRWSSNFNQV